MPLSQGARSGVSECTAPATGLFHAVLGWMLGRHTGLRQEEEARKERMSGVEKGEGREGGRRQGETQAVWGQIRESKGHRPTLP